ncbi:MAG: hypothetical protein LBK22_11165 [Tannerella sp.]|jgi:hypothetical protein|nr:hypothetical protein [Tannerella sp.]
MKSQTKIIFLYILLAQQWPAQASDVSFSVRKNTYVTNPSGISVGFWPNYRQQHLVFSEFGRRGIERSGFYGWKDYEPTPGVYVWGAQFDLYKRAHLFGNDVIGCANISFSPRTSSAGKLTIPEFYPDSIVDPLTRTAAKKYLYALVQEMLTQCGSMQLAIDYETSYNYGFGTGSQAPAAIEQAVRRAEEWGAWYVEAADTMRKAAADIGMSDRLRLIPIMNADPRNQSVMQRGVEANQWMCDVVRASDILGYDTYQRDTSKPMTDPSCTLDVAQYWIDNYAGGKPVFMCETGFPSVMTGNPDFVIPDGKYYGTESEQSLFYRNLLDSIAERSRPGGSFKSVFRGLCIWSFSDNSYDDPQSPGYFFGLFKTGRSPKPAAATVREKIREMEARPEICPRVLQSSEDVVFSPDATLPVTFTSGTEHHSLSLLVDDFEPGQDCLLHIETKHPGGVLLTVNGERQLYDVSIATHFDFDLKQLLQQGENGIEIFFTGEKLPFEQSVKNIQFNDGGSNTAILHPRLLPSADRPDAGDFSCRFRDDAIEITQKNPDRISIRICSADGVLIHALTTSEMCSAFHLHDCRGVYLVFIRSEATGATEIHKLISPQAPR